MDSGALSQRNAVDLPHHLITCTKARITRLLSSDLSTSIIKPLRLQSSITLNVLGFKPYTKLSICLSMRLMSWVLVFRAAHQMNGFLTKLGIMKLISIV